MPVLPCPFFIQQGIEMRGVVVLHKRAITLLGEKWARPFGLSLKKRHAALFVVHLE